MSRWLYLTPEGMDAAPGDWPVRHGGPGVTPSSCSLAEAGPWLHGQAVQVILPIELCSWLRSAPWPGRRQPQAQALAYAIEEQLGEDLEGLHIAIGRPDDERCYPMLIIARPLLRSLLSALQEAGIQVAGLRVDADLLPADQACGMWWAGRWLLGGALQARLALSAQALNQVQAYLPDTIHWHEPHLLADDVDINALLTHGNAQAINLLQGEFRPAQGRWRWQPWLLTLAGLFVLSWGFTQLRSQHLEARAADLYAQSLQRFRTLYPEQTRIVDLSAQLKALQGKDPQQRGAMMDLLQRVDEVIGGSGVQVQRIEFNATQGWKLTLRAGSFSELERLRERSQQSGSPVSLDNASKDRDGVQALLIIPARAS